MEGKRIAGTSAKYLIFGLWSLLTLVAFLWIILSSFKSNQELFNNIWGFPEKLRLENYVRAWVKGRIGSYFFNSIIYVVFSVLILGLAGSMAAYAFTRSNVKKWSGIVYLVVLFGMSIPAQLAIIPLYLNFARFRLLNRYIGLIFAYTSAFMPFTIFVLSGFFRTIPKEMEDAAEIDGCSRWKTFWRIIMPMAQPGLVTIAIFNILTVWNEYLFAMILITKEKVMPLSAGLYNLRNQQRIAQDWTSLIAGIVILFIPTLIIFIILQNKISEGITVGAIKG